MKKTLLLFLACVLAESAAICAEKPGIDLRFSQSLGIGSFFDTIMSTGATWHPYPGAGIMLGGWIPVAFDGRLALLPELSVHFGNVDHLIIYQDAQWSKKHFTQYGTGLNLAFSFTKPVSRWSFYALGGLFARHVSSGGYHWFDRKNHLGWQGGIGLRFLPSGHWGLVGQAVYQESFHQEKVFDPFSDISRTNSSLALQGGVFYAF